MSSPDSGLFRKPAFRINCGARTHSGGSDRLAVHMIRAVSGAEYAYRVDRVENVQPQDVAAVTESGAALTLYTCTPGGKTRVAVYCSAAR